MARFTDRFVEDVKRAISVLEYAKRQHKVEKSGVNFVLASNRSLTISPVKNLWYDHGGGASGQKGGDVISFEQMLSGCSFAEAVERVASAGGVALPDARRTNGAAEPDLSPEPPAHPGLNGSTPPKARREITKTYDYVDASGGLIYQVCRLEWVEDGKRKKTFLQRRRAPDGAWAWGLSEGTYLRSKHNGEWYAATKDRMEKWADAPSVDLEKVEHGLYRLDELREEAAQEPDERATIYVCEGEKDVETMRAWGLVATTNSGGAGNWCDRMAEELRDSTVVVLCDNDPAGEQREYKIAASLRPIVRSLRVLRWPEHWAGCPPKGDVTDWVEKGGGTLEKFLPIVDKIEEWRMRPPTSQLGALRFVDLGKPRAKLEWLVKGVLQRRELSLWFGDWGTGKSFLMMDAGFAIARGISWMGLRTFPGLVLYQTGEGSTGYGNRMDAYRRHYRLPADDDIPFIALRERVNLFVSDADVRKLIEEAKAWSRFYNLSVELLVIDTFSAATAGAEENSGRDVGPVLERCRRASVELSCHVAIVHHVPKTGGTPRGWSGFLGNVETGVLVETLDQPYEEKTDGGTRHMPHHRMTVVKQKDAANQLKRTFVLPQVEVGVDGDGDKITSCVVKETSGGESAGNSREVPKGYAVMIPQNHDIMRCLVKALKKVGRSAPAGISAPPGVDVVTIGEWNAELLELSVGHEEVTATLKERIRKRVQRACKAWDPDGLNFITKDKEYVWRTSRKIFGIDPNPVRQAYEPQVSPMTLTKGGTTDDVADLLSS